MLLAQQIRDEMMSDRMLSGRQCVMENGWACVMVLLDEGCRGLMNAENKILCI